MRNPSIAALTLAAALALVSGCTTEADRGGTASAADLPSFDVPAGVQLHVRLATNLSSETAQVGDPWSGTLASAVAVADREILPAGTTVRGAVTGAHPAGLGTRAMLDLTVQDVVIDGAPRPLTAGMDAILADLPAAPSGAGGGTATTLGSASERRPVPAAKGTEVALGAGDPLVFTVQEHSIR